MPFSTQPFFEAIPQILVRRSKYRGRRTPVNYGLAAPRSYLPRLLCNVLISLKLLRTAGRSLGLALLHPGWWKLRHPSWVHFIEVE